MLNIKQNLIKDSSYDGETLLIKKYFESYPVVKNNKDNLSVIKTRLILIDALYSTQIFKNRFAINDISKKINKFNSDYEINLKINSFLNDFNKKNDILDLFNTTYGHLNKKAMSLISKYLFFVSNYNFPIYDSLVKKEIKYSKDNIIEYIRRINFLSNNYLVNDNKLSYKDFDFILWFKSKEKSKNFNSIFKNYLKKEKVIADFNKFIQNNNIEYKLNNYILDYNSKGN